MPLHSYAYRHTNDGQAAVQIWSYTSQREMSPEPSRPHPLHHLHECQQRLVLEADIFKYLNEVGQVEMIPPVLKVWQM